MFSSRLDDILKRSLFVYLVIPILGLVFLVTLYLGWQQKQQIEAQEQIRAQNVAQAVQIYVNNLRSELQKFAVFLTSKQMDPARKLLEYLYFHSEFDRLLLLEKGRIIHSLPGMSREFVALSSIFDPSQLEMDFQVQISAPYRSSTSGEMCLSLLSATRAGSRLVGEIRLQSFQRLIKKFISNQARHIFITDRFGNVLAHPDSSLVAQQANLGNLPPLRRASRERSPMSDICSYQGELHLVSLASVPLSSWRIVTSTPLFTLIGPLLKYLVLLLALILAGTALFSRIILRKLQGNVIDPLNRLTANTSQIKHGEPLSPIASSKRGSTFQELEDLKDEFNSMAKVLSLRESSLRQKNMEQRMLLDHVPLQIWFITEPRTQGAVNKARAEFLGRSVQEVSHKPYLEILDRETALKAIELNREVYVTRAPVQVEDWFLDARGNQRYLAVTRTPKLNPDGEVEFVVCTAEDITERWYFQEQLRRLSTAVEQSAASILITDRNGVVEYANPRYCSLTGFASEELIGEPAAILQSESLSTQERSNLWRTIASGGTWKGELQERSKDGKLYWIRLSISPISNQQEEITHYVVILDDITAKKQAEHELLRAKLEAEQANAAKSEFLANVSHEIRTPMNGIIGMTNLLLSSELSYEQREFTEVIQSSADSMMAVINQILDFSKLESTALEIEDIDFDLRKDLESWLDPFTLRSQEKGIELFFWLDPAIPERLTGDPMRLRQVLSNLAENALKFTEQGWIAMRGFLQSASEERIKLLFEVEDTGAGIPEGKLESIFEPFSQADGSTTRKHGGTGLGLAICKQLSEMMGGQIGVQTQVRKGSLFWFTLQLKKAAHQPGSREAAIKAVREGVEEITLLQPKASEHLEQVAALLHALDIPLTSCETPEQLKALLGAHRSRAHILLLDEAHLGAEMSQRLQAWLQEKQPGTGPALILLSKRSLIQEAPHSQLRSSSYALYKPIKEGALLLALARALDLENELPAADRPEEPPLAAQESPPGEARLLLAEDDSVNQKVMLHILDKLGYQPEVAGNGREALEKMAERDFDLVFMDLEMPEMDGLEATQRLRSRSGETGPPLQPENGQPVVVGLSAHAGEGFRQKCSQAGMNDFLSKPVTLEDLRLVLQRWLGNGNGGQGAADHEPAKAPEGKPLFDHHKLLEQLGGDAELLEQLLDIFIQDAPPRLERIRQALADEDWASLEQAVHALKGSAASIGANTLYQSVHELGRACERNDRQRADRLLQQVESDLRTLQHALPGQE